VRVRAVWAIHGVILAATLVTYARLPPGATYRFDLTGVAGAVSRAVTYLNFPVALAALALLWPLLRRPAARAAALLCAVAAIPGVVSTTTMEARWWNVPAACGVLLAVPLTLSLPRDGGPLGTARAVGLSILVALSTPWILAAAGVYARDVPPLGLFFRSAEPTPGDPSLPSVHLGLHEGLFGAQLAVTALLASRRPASRAHALYLSLLLAYGVAIAVEDGWDEQVVKRGLTTVRLPSVLEPAPTLAWGCLIAAGIALHFAWWPPRPAPPATG
jgi:hypothetical protein